MVYSDVIRQRFRSPRYRGSLPAPEAAFEEIRQSIGADTLGFVSLEGLTEATTLPASALCRACFNGDYPIPVSESEQGKQLLESSAAGGRPR